METRGSFSHPMNIISAESETSLFWWRGSNLPTISPLVGEMSRNDRGGMHSPIYARPAVTHPIHKIQSIRESPL
ncbi:hypothetical protein DQ393_21775 [Rhizobium tropici]|uniref:Uncharacterized protein n=1 Tax=Rhizobium tropici TaxID=398 RepID=A0A329Y8I4_RHITR|nr:hypothetical protein DQ393_21775 [Rhizobium tropici]